MELREKLKPAKHFTNLLNLLSSSKFLNMEGLGIEIPFYIYPFSPKETVQIYTVINNLITQLKQRGIIVLEINLYLASLEILKERGILPWILENETISVTSQELFISVCAIRNRVGSSSPLKRKRE